MSKIDIANNSKKTEDLVSIKGYTIQERIGIGSYGRVYKVLKDNKIYVLKEIPLNMGNLNNPKPEKIATVQNEAEILSSLNNKYIVKFYESFKQNQNIYIVMEYCEGGDLCTFMRECKKKRKNEEYFLDEDFVWKIFIQISIGLYYIHSKKILHRDIKTLNIFLTNNFDGKIGDLGVAKVLEDTNHAMTFVGTPYYVSPEMCKNRPYNEKSDIWALGCILYEMLTFRHPFTASNQAALFIKILNGNYTPLPLDTPNDLKFMVEFILQKNENKRPTMKEIITKNIFQYNAERLGLGEDLKEVLDVKFLSYNMEKNEIMNSNLYIDDNIWSNRDNINNNITNSVIGMKCKLGKSPKTCKKSNNKNNSKGSNSNINNELMKNKTKAVLKTPKNLNQCQLVENDNKKEQNKILKKSINEIKNSNNVEKLKKETSENNNNQKNIKKRKMLHKNNNKLKSHKINSNEKNNIINTNDLFSKIVIKNSILNHNLNNSNSPRKTRPIELNNIFNNNINYLNHNLKQKSKQITSDSKDGSATNNNTNTQKKENNSGENLNKIRSNINSNNNIIINNAKTSTNNSKILNNPLNINLKNKKIKEIIKSNNNSNVNINNINLNNNINISNRRSLKQSSGEKYRSKNLKRVIEKEKLSLEKKENNNEKNKNNNSCDSSNSDIIKESDFINALNNTIKNYPLIITLSDLYNHQFNADDTKNMNTTSATTALGKVDMPTISVEEINEENKNDFNQNNLIKIREETKEDTIEIINNSCDEFSQTEMIKRTNTNLIKKISNFNYDEKIKENKMEIKNMIEMPKDELMKTSEIYRIKYDYYLDKINQYKDIIDIEMIRKYYANVGYANDQQINTIFNKIIQHINQKLPSKKAEELSDIIYNLICFEIKFKIAQKTIKMKS